MTILKDPIMTGRPPPDGIELPVLREPESIDTPFAYVDSHSATLMTTAELAHAETAPAPPRFNRHGDRVSHITDRFVLGGNRECYRIWKFQSTEEPVEFPVTDEGWVLAWTTFRRLESAAP